MGNLVFPAPQRQRWSWKWPVKKTPVFSTITQTPLSGVGEVRIPVYQYPRWQFELDIDYIKGNFSDPQSAISQLIGFWMAVQGAADDWLYDDPDDDFVSQMQFGTGDGSTTSFQLTRTIGGGVDIIQNLNGAPNIYINGALQNPSGYSISTTGRVQFGTAPASGAVLTWTGGFYFRCRFNEDALESLEQFMYRIWSLHSLKFISVILPTT